MACTIRNTPAIHGLKPPDCEVQPAKEACLRTTLNSKGKYVFMLSEIHDMLVNLGRFSFNLPINNPFDISLFILEPDVFFNRFRKPER
jgi:hypothetical protein